MVLLAPPQIVSTQPGVIHINGCGGNSTVLYTNQSTAQGSYLFCVNKGSLTDVCSVQSVFKPEPERSYISAVMHSSEFLKVKNV